METDVREHEEWLPIQVAAQRFGVPVRTVYTCIKRGQVRSRKLGRSREVLAEDVMARAARRAANLPSNVRQDGGHPATAVPVATQQEDSELAETRKRIELARLEEEKLKAEESLRRARIDTEAADDDRRLRRQQLALDAERQQAEIAQTVWRFEQERSVSAHARAADAEQRQREERRAEERLAHEARQQRAAAERAQWRRGWIAAAVSWTERELGPAMAARAATVASRVLEDLGPNDPDDAVRLQVRRGVSDELAEAFAVRNEGRREAARGRLIDEVLAYVCVVCSPQTRDRVKAVVEDAVVGIDPEDADAQEQLFTRARAEFDRAQAEEQQERVRHDTERDWNRIRAGIGPTAQRLLPPAATSAEQEELAHALTALWRERPNELRPRDFHEAASRVAIPYAKRVAERIDSTEWRRIGERIPEFARRARGWGSLSVDQVDELIKELRALHTSWPDHRDEGAFWRAAQARADAATERSARQQAWIDAIHQIPEIVRRSLPGETEDAEIESAEAILQDLVEDLQQRGADARDFRREASAALRAAASAVQERLERAAWSALARELPNKVEAALPRGASPSELDDLAQELRLVASDQAQRRANAGSFMTSIDVNELVRRHSRRVERRIAIEHAAAEATDNVDLGDEAIRVAYDAARPYEAPEVAGAAARDAVWALLRRGRDK